MVMKDIEKSLIVESRYPDLEIPVVDLWTFMSKKLSKHSLKYMIDASTGEKYAYDEVKQLVERIAGHYQDVGIGPGVKVVFLSKNSAVAALSYLAVLAAGATVVPITMAYSASDDDFVALAKITGCTYCICGEDYIHQGIAFQERLSNACKGMFLTGGNEPNFINVSNLLKTRSSKQYKKHCIDPKNDISVIVFTSGTTGLPKAILHTHYSFVSSAIIAINPPLEMLSEPDIMLIQSPFVHGSGFLSILFAIAAGASAVVADGSNLNSQKFANILKKYKISNLFGFPTAFGNLIKGFDSTENLSSVRRLMLGGSSVSEALVQLVFKHFKNMEDIRQTYGLSEALGALTSTIPKSNDAFSAGVVSPNTKIKICNPETGEILAKNCTGEICIKTPLVMKGYLNNPEATAAAFDQDGFLRGGDLGYFTDDGQLFIVDRIKAMIKCLDYQVSPAELENILLQHKLVREVCVVGVPMTEYGEAPTACIALIDLADESNELKTQLINMVNESGGHYSKRLHGGLYFFDSLPKTATGKHIKKELLKLIESKKAK